MEPHARVARCFFQWERLSMEWCGHGFIAEPFKPNFMTFLARGLISVGILSCMYTIAYYDVSAKVFCVLALMTIMQALGKMYHVRYGEDYLWCLNFIQNLYNVHAKSESRDRAEYFRKFALFTEFLFKFLVAMLMLALMFVAIVPVYVYATENKLVPLIPIYVPGIDETKTTGYILLILLHSAQLLMGIIGYLAFEFLLETIVINSLIFGKLIASDTELISNDLENGMIIDATHRLRNTFLMHQEMAAYMERIDKVTFKVIFIHLSTATLGSIVCLCGILLFKLIIVIGLFGFLMIQIMLNCLLGNCVELSHDQIYDAALELKWYLLPLKEQHFYRFYIQRCQGPTLLSVGGFKPLNMETAHLIYSKIYSFTMFLMMMVE